MPKQRGFKPGGMPNPMLAARTPPTPTSGFSIRDHFNRPRPSLDGIFNHHIIQIAFICV